MKVVGLTGGIATGKSTTSQLLEAQGFPIIDCDKIAHDVVRKGRWGWRRVVAAFGPDILDSSGELDRAKLGRLVFGDPALRRRLNQATHLPVGLAILKRLAWYWLTCRQVVIIDMPLLIETGTYRWTHPVLLVSVDAGTQMRRLIARDGLTPEEAAQRVQSQMPLADKARCVDAVISNEGPIQQLQQQVADVGVHLRRTGRWKHWILSPVGLAAGLLVIASAISTRHA